MPADGATIGISCDVRYQVTYSFVGVVDKIFARVGAHDNIVKNMSTFHMEMAETAHILTSATQRSFVLLDEIGGYDIVLRIGSSFR